MNFKFKLFASLLFYVSLLSSCGVPLAKEMLFAGQPTAGSAEPMAIVDGVGQAARFSNIEHFWGDEDGNLYVFDTLQNKRSSTLNTYPTGVLRKINAITKQVESLLQSSQLIISDITSRNNIAYLGAPGCIQKLDLSQQVYRLELIYGSCLQDATANGVGFVTIQPQQQIYVSIATDDSNSYEYLRISLEEQIQGGIARPLLPQPFSDFSSIMSHKGQVFALQQGPSGPGPAGQNIILHAEWNELKSETNKSRARTSTLFQDRLMYPQYLLLDTEDRLYFIEKNILKRITNVNTIEALGFIDLNKASFVGAYVDPQARNYYYATKNAIYRLPLPISKEKNNE